MEILLVEMVVLVVEVLRIQVVLDLQLLIKEMLVVVLIGQDMIMDTVVAVVEQQLQELQEPMQLLQVMVEPVPQMVHLLFIILQQLEIQFFR
jgi:hypothetical protein